MAVGWSVYGICAAKRTMSMSMEYDVSKYVYDRHDKTRCTCDSNTDREYIDKWREYVCGMTMRSRRDSESEGRKTDTGREYRWDGELECMTIYDSARI